MFMVFSLEISPLRICAFVLKQYLFDSGFLMADRRQLQWFQKESTDPTSQLI